MPTGLKVLAIYTIIFTQMLDTSVANLSLTNISSSLFMDVYYSSWIMTSFGTGLVISFSLGNLLGKLFSTDAILVSGVMIFILASLGCGVSENSTEFLIWRFLQGIGSGIAVVVSQSHLFAMLGESRRTFAISLWGSAFSLAPVLGPLVGAFITENFSWRWLFLINVPLMSLSLFILLPEFSMSKIKDDVKGLPILTLVAFALMVASMQYSLDFGEQLGWLSDSKIIVAAIVSALSLIVFVHANRKKALFDFSVFLDRNYAIATSISCIGNGLLFASIVLLPLWMQRDYNMPILEAGIIVSVASGVAAISTPFLGKYLPSKWFGFAAIFSLIATAISFAMMGEFGLDVSREYMIASRLVAGLGLSVFTLPLTALALKNIPKEQVVNANAIGLMLRVVFANISVAIGFTLFKHLRQLQEYDFYATPDRLTILKYQNGLPETIGNYMTHVFSTNAITQVFWGSAIIFCVFAIIIAPLVTQLTKE